MKAPNEIWLQVFEDEYDYTHTCHECVNDTDIRYVRADIVKADEELIRELAGKLKEYISIVPSMIHNDVIIRANKRLE